MGLKQRKPEKINENEQLVEKEDDSHERCDPLGGSSLKMSIDSSALSGYTITWESLPDWMRDNQYIRSGYRRQQNSWKGCLQSMFGYLHNETVNIHTHLWGAAFFFVLLVITLSNTLRSHSSVTWHDVAGFAVFLGAAILCLSFSAAFHTGNCHSLSVAKSCVLFDYTGILALIVGSFFPSIYYGFYCYPEYQVMYLTTILLAGLGAAYIVLTPSYNCPELRWARTVVFVGLGLTGIVPIGHAWWLHGWRALHEEMGMGWLLASGALYMNGAVMYATRTPERFFPGKLDYFGASHQIFHVHVVLAAIAHYVSIYSAYNYQHGTRAGTCPVPMLLSENMPY